jgi:hypothetical protein
MQVVRYSSTKKPKKIKKDQGEREESASSDDCGGYIEHMIGYQPMNNDDNNDDGKREKVRVYRCKEAVVAGM